MARRRRRRRYRFRLKPAGYAFFGIVFLLIGLGVFFIVRAIVNGVKKSQLASALPTPSSSIAVAMPTPTPSLAPTATPTITVETTPTPPEPAQTAAPNPTEAPAKATPTPSSSIRKATSDEKKNAKAGYLTGNDVNLRAGPSKDYMSLGKYSKDATLLVYATDGKFYFVRMDKDKKVGFMSKSFIKISEASAKTAAVPSGAIGGSVTASKVALRDGASKTSTAIGELHAGDQVFIYHKSGDFYYLQAASSGRKGYAYASYISASGTVPVR